MDLIKTNNLKGLKIVNKSSIKAEILMYGAIGDFFWEDSFSIEDFKNALDEIPDTVTEIDLRVNSPGGDVFAGYVMYNRLRQHKAKVTAYVDGYAGSIASLIILAADEVVMGEVATIMIHKPWAFTGGNSSDLMNLIERLDAIEDQLISVYKRKTGIDRTELTSMLAKETEFSSAQAVEAGFADRIETDEENVAIAACVSKANWIKNKPSNKKVEEKLKAQISASLKDMTGFLAR